MSGSISRTSPYSRILQQKQKRCVGENGAMTAADLRLHPVKTVVGRSFFQQDLRQIDLSRFTFNNCRFSSCKVSVGFTKASLHNCELIKVYETRPLGFCRNTWVGGAYLHEERSIRTVISFGSEVEQARGKGPIPVPAHVIKHFVDAWVQTQIPDTAVPVIIEKQSRRISPSPALFQNKTFTPQPLRR